MSQFFYCVSSPFSPFFVELNCISLETIQTKLFSTAEISLFVICKWLKMVKSPKLFKESDFFVISFFVVVNFLYWKEMCVLWKFVWKDWRSRVHRLCQSINHIQFDATQTHAIIQRYDGLRLNANNSTAGFMFGITASTMGFTAYTKHYA